jgi:hypothetical protein
VVCAYIKKIGTSEYSHTCPKYAKLVPTLKVAYSCGSQRLQRHFPPDLGNNYVRIPEKRYLPPDLGNNYVRIPESGPF